jgi:hypothetical protein
MVAVHLLSLSKVLQLRRICWQLAVNPLLLAKKPACFNSSMLTGWCCAGCAVQGRSGKTGIATTFINSRQCSESILLDLKHLLKEAKQRVPHFLTVSCHGASVVHGTAAAISQQQRSVSILRILVCCTRRGSTAVHSGVSGSFLLLLDCRACLVLGATIV